ncbi:MAG: DNA cytosine methyltransferase [Chthoniobacterales bacterium]
MEFLYNRTCFKDRYKRQHRERPCSTIVAHLSKDGLMFIHPTQCRTLTPREAARVQTFPDWFEFPVARTHQFRLIGNAVPPLVAEAVGEEIRDFLRQKPASARVGNDARRLPLSRVSAARELEQIATLDARALRSLGTDDFLRGWHALLFLFPGLHPDNALDHGTLREDSDQLPLPSFEWLLRRRYVRSGWPVALEAIGREAWRRRDRGEVRDDAFYCTEAQAAGLRIQSSRRLGCESIIPVVSR